jgi:hypothetical protein
MRVNYRTIVLLSAGLMLLCQSRAQETSHGIYQRLPEKREDLNRHPSSITYQNTGLRLKKINDPSGIYYRIMLPGHHWTTETGKPELPVYSRLIFVTAGTKVKVLLSDIITERISLEEQGIKGTQLFPAQPAKTKNEVQDEKVVVKDLRIYETRGVISHDTVVVSHEGIFRGRELVNITVCPAFYDPTDGYVDMITSMNMKIIYVPSDSKGDEDNPDLTDKGTYSSDTYVTGYTDKPVYMIIVTDSMFSKHLKPLIKWKMLKGIKTKILYKGAGPPDTVYSDLKKRITAIYSEGITSGTPVQYLMIVGDQTIIPTARGTSNVSDLYYGEFDGEGDYIPELFIGRLPVSDTSQLKGMVKKIIDYETLNYSHSNNFWSGAITTAGNAPGFENYMNGQVNYIYRNYLSQDTSMNPIRWLYPDAPNKDDSLKILFNSGLCLLNYTGHGEAAGLSDPTFKTPAVADLTNHNKYPLIIANACRTAQINVSTCFGSAIVNAVDKGALGYIGCTNDSYWTEDFFWSVGPGTLGIDADYENTELGAFDRLFHTHSEPPGDWCYTLGQINFAGNLAVSSSSSPRKKYYWETYMLLGDPTLTPVTGRPDTFDISIPDTLPNTLSSLSFFATPFAYAALSDFDTLWDARFVSPSGNIALNIPSGTKDSCLLIITGQNMLPFRKVIHFGTVHGPFITADKAIFDDSGGNGDGIPEYGERINLKIKIRNLGESPSANLVANLSVLSGMITIESGTASIGVLAPGGTFEISNSFIFNVSDQVSDGELASLLLELTENGEKYTFGIDMTLHAPKLKIISSIHDDTSTGNSNWLPEAGEEIILNVTLKNEGSSGTSGIARIVPRDPWMTLQNAEIATGILNPGSEKTLSFEAYISNDAVSGTVIHYDVQFICGKYQTEGSWSLSTGKTRETWEFERFDVFPWIRNGGDYPWTITTSSSFENTHSARSGAIPDKSETILAIYVNNPVRDTISFWSRVSSEPNYDQMIFRIDSITDMQISGDTPWALRKAIINPGVHYLEWVYRKDVSLSGGLDAAWIDQITFPDISFLEADLRIDSVFTPPATADLNKITIRGRVINLGRNTLTSFPLAYKVNDAEPVNETFYLKIDPGDTIDVAFSQTCSLLPDVINIINIISLLPEDGYSGNDTAYTSFVKSGIGPDLTENKVRLMPNPFKESFTLELEVTDENEADLELIDSGGKIIFRSRYELTPGINRIPVDCHYVAGGVYTLRITSGGKSLSMKAVKGR